ncbi:MAG: Na+/H+ antiporter NhaC [Tissierellia bacterium]|nr:Na+/H+ antiporter NhaC [Tissierellia bacterium]
MFKNKNDKIRTKVSPSVGYAVLILVTLAIILISGIRVFNAPLAVIMFLAWIVINAFAYKLGYSYRELEEIAIGTIRNSIQAVIIMLAVGVLIGSWIASGTVPTIIYYGLKILSPNYYLVTTLIICALVSMFTGTSWGTIGTVGVALLGIGIGMGINPGMIAGALISGSWFGDKLSPLSDTTNFASSVMGVDLMKHVKHMLYTTIPALTVSAIIFLILGFGVKIDAANINNIAIISNDLSQYFKINPITLIPMIVVITLLIKQKPASQAILVGAALGMVFAIFYQKFDASMVLKAGLTGFNYEFDNEFLTKLLNRGGMDSMTRTIQALIFTTGLGGMLREMDVLKVLVSKISHKIKSTFVLVLSAVSVSYLSIGLTGSHMFAAIMVQSTMLDLFKKNGLKPENLSRICEDCGTLGVTLIPYGVTALFIIDTLGIPFSQFAPYTFFCYLCPIFTLLLGLTGIGISRYSDEEMKQMNLKEA